MPISKFGLFAVPSNAVFKVGATDAPEVFKSVSEGVPRRPTKAVPRLVGEESSSTRVSALSSTSPVFSTIRVKVTSKVPSASKPATSALLAMPIPGCSPGGATGVGTPGPPGLSVGSSPVGFPSISVLVLVSSVTGTALPRGRPLAVAVLFSTAGAPSAFGFMMTAKLTMNTSPASNRVASPISRSVPPARPVKPAPVLIGATDRPFALVVSSTTGGCDTDTKAVPRLAGSARLSVRRSCDSGTSPVFCTTIS